MYIYVCVYVSVLIDWTYYFSTQGCRRLSSAGLSFLLEPAFAAIAAAWRALMSKKLAMVLCNGMVLLYCMYNGCRCTVSQVIDR